MSECADARIERLLANLVVNRLPYRFPAIDRAFDCELLAQLDGAIERDPGHDFGIREVLAPTPDFPDAFIRLAPYLGEVIEEGAL